MWPHATYWGIPLLAVTAVNSSAESNAALSDRPGRIVSQRFAIAQVYCARLPLSSATMSYECVCHELGLWLKCDFDKLVEVAREFCHENQCIWTAPAGSCNDHRWSHHDITWGQHLLLYRNIARCWWLWLQLESTLYHSMYCMTLDMRTLISVFELAINCNQSFIENWIFNVDPIVLRECMEGTWISWDGLSATSAAQCWG